MTLPPQKTDTRQTSSTLIGRLIRTVRTDEYVRRVIRQAGTVVSGNFVAAILQFASLALAARVLGTERFGLFALLVSSVFMVDGLLNVQATSAIIRFGAAELELGQRERLLGLVRLGLWVDSVTSVFATLAAAACVWMLGLRLGWSGEVMALGMLYSLRVLVNVTGTARALLRLFDRFALQATMQSAGAATKALGALIAWQAGAGLSGFVVAWLVSEVLESVLLLASSLRVLRHHGYPLMRPFPTVTPTGFWGFLWSTNLSDSVTSLRQADTLIVGTALGPSAAGMLQVAKQFAAVLRQLSVPLRQVVFPAFAKLSARGELRELQRATRLSLIVASCGAALAWSVFVLLGYQIIRVSHGPAYTSAYAVGVWYVLGSGITLATFPLQPAVLALGRSWAHLAIQIATYGLFVPLLYVLTTAFGLQGAGAAYAIQQLFRAACMMLLRRVACSTQVSSS